MTCCSFPMIFFCTCMYKISRALIAVRNGKNFWNSSYRPRAITGPFMKEKKLVNPRQLHPRRRANEQLSNRAKHIRQIHNPNRPVTSSASSWSARIPALAWRGKTYRSSSPRKWHEISSAPRAHQCLMRRKAGRAIAHDARGHRWTTACAYYVNGGARGAGLRHLRSCALVRTVWRSFAELTGKESVAGWFFVGNAARVTRENNIFC